MTSTTVSGLRTSTVTLIGNEEANVTQNGAISQLSGVGIDVTAAGNTGVAVNNSGSIFGNIDGIRATGHGTNIVNTGTITGRGTAINFNDDTDGGTGNTVINSGTISGIDSGADGILSQSSGMEIINSGQILTAGDNAIQINNNVPSAGTNFITNSGLIATIPSASDSTSRLAIFTNSEVDLITNTGSIIGGIDTQEEDDDLINSGDITGNIDMGTGEDVLVNSGFIEGSVLMGDNNDTFDGRGGTVTGAVIGGAGDDLYQISDGSSILFETMGAGTDTVQSEASYTLAQNIEILTLLGAEDINGAGNGLANTITGNDGANLLQGRVGDDTIQGGGGDDTIGGGANRDSLEGGEGDDYINGGAQSDTVRGDEGNDTLRGGLNNDLITGGDGEDNIAGGLGNDTMAGNDGDDAMFGQGGNDVFNGGEGEDYIHGGAGVDALTGANGDDTLVGGAGADTLTGGNGADVFLFQNFAQSPVGDVDTITDFEVGTDLIDVTALVPGQIAFGGTGAASANGTAELLIREPGGGPDTVVFVDVNGDGTQDFRLELTGVTGLSETDFLL